MNGCVKGQRVEMKPWGIFTALYIIPHHEYSCCGSVHVCQARFMFTCLKQQFNPKIDILLSFTQPYVDPNSYDLPQKEKWMPCLSIYWKWMGTVTQTNTITYENMTLMWINTIPLYEEQTILPLQHENLEGSTKVIWTWNCFSSR